MGILQGWHRGEKAIQEKLGFAGPMAMGYTWIDAEMPEQHREFHTTRLPFIPVATLDEQQRPWTSIFAAQSGEPGFVTSPSYNRLDMDIRLWEGDPFWENVQQFNGQKMLMAGIGIEFPTRRRNKFAGLFTNIQQKNDMFHLEATVNEAIGNCPKYINVREIDPHPDTFPIVVHKRRNMNQGERLPDEVIQFIIENDTVFLGSVFQPHLNESIRYSSHVGQNQRGGRKGWVRVKPSDGRTVVLPDYSGNRLMTSLGNIEATPVASVTMVDFVTGDVLYLTGDARTLVGPESLAVMPLQKVVTELAVTGYVFVRDALPVRQRPGTQPTRSPYSPPVRLLAEEVAAGTSKYFDDDTTVTLASVKLLSGDLAIFTWETSKNVVIKPGQTAILGFADLVGATQYQHMAPFKPTSVNDDRIRTWTVSSAHLAPEGTKSFDLTMREKPDGVVTGALFKIARKLAEMRPELLQDTRPLGLQVKLVGISGDFALALPSSPQEPAPRPMLWLAGGIGITPFLSMLAAIALSADSGVRWDAVLALSTREPEVLVPLVAAALGGRTPKLRLAIHIFSDIPVPAFPTLPPADEFEVTFDVHQGRVGKSVFEMGDLKDRKVYMCGPEEFERAMLDTLSRYSVKDVVRESFEY